MKVVNNFNCRGFGPLLEDKLCLIFKLAPSVCRMTFFIFQAEDGIRDYKVTGVQTCALPICPHVGERDQLRAGGVRQLPLPSPRLEAVEVGSDERSEERRVGKECRSRWSPYH